MNPRSSSPAVPALVLASSSRWRRQLLAASGIEALGVAPVVDEAAIVGPDPVTTAKLRAEAKAVEVSGRHAGALVVGADQVVHLQGETIGKPTDPDDWMNRLQRFRGRPHQLTTAVALAQDGLIVDSFDVHTRVVFRDDVTDAELSAYVSWGEAAGCAGGYMVEGRGVWLVAALDGDYTNVVGLPVFHLVSRLRARGWRLVGGGEARPT